MLKSSLRASLAALAALACSPASAALWNNWDTDSVSTTVTTNNNLGPNDAYIWRNITKFWYASDATNAYFRMDLQGGPGADNASFAEPMLYAVYVDSKPLGGSGEDWSYLYWDGTEVTGIDYIIDVHFADFGVGVITGEHVHTYTGNPPNPSGFTFGDYASKSVDDLIDPTLHSIEWSAPLANFGLTTFDPAVIYAATYNISTPTASYDLARLDINAAEAPLPATWLFLAPGVLLLRNFRRLRS